MALNYYDDAIIHKLKSWIPDTSRLRVLKSDESDRFFQLRADDNDDREPELPMITLSRSPDIELLSNIKQERSFNGLRILDHTTKEAIPTTTAVFNVIPIKVQYQIDIYTKLKAEGDEYLRNFAFKLINNPLLIIEIPYNNFDIRHTANIRVLPTLSDTSDITERKFKGQFSRHSIQLELQDGFLFSIPYKQNWSFLEPGLELADKIQDPDWIVHEVVSQAETPYSDINEAVKLDATDSMLTILNGIPGLEKLTLKLHSATQEEREKLQDVLSYFCLAINSGRNLAGLNLEFPYVNKEIAPVVNLSSIAKLLNNPKFAKLQTEILDNTTRTPTWDELIRFCNKLT